MPKRSSDNYIQLKKKITDKEILNIVLILKKEWAMETSQQVCYHFVREGALKEINKRKQMSAK